MTLPQIIMVDWLQVLQVSTVLLVTHLASFFIGVFFAARCREDEGE